MQLDNLNHYLSQQFEDELRGNILPFWVNTTPDRENGGFFGAVTNSGRPRNQVERSAVLCGRILWTFSTAAQLYKEVAYLQTANWAFTELTSRFWDEKYHGIYWSLAANGQPVNDRKHTYAQAFAIYGLSAYYQATQNPNSLVMAKAIYALIEGHTFDVVNGGNIECRARDWSALEDMRLSDKDINSAKSMNTLLHLMEAYSALIKIWPDDSLRDKLTGLIHIFLERVIDPETGHQRLFFTDQWESVSEHVSYGHDIEASWLLLEAAQALGDADLIARAASVGVRMAQAVFEQSLGADGSILYEADTKGNKVLTRHWWAHAEAVVGFYNAWQLSGQDHFARASEKVWQYIQTHFVDRKNGDWFKLLKENGTPILSHYKVGPWECPYHHARMCMEMIRRTLG